MVSEPKVFLQINHAYKIWIDFLFLLRIELANNFLSPNFFISFDGCIFFFWKNYCFRFCIFVCLLFTKNIIIVFVLVK